LEWEKLTKFYEVINEFEATATKPKSKLKIEAKPVKEPEKIGQG